MLKTILTLLRGTVSAAENELADRGALVILDQQIRDAAAAIERSKRALAVAIAQDEAEARRLDKTLVRIADLEERAIAALNGGREDLATEAAEAIAVMEDDRDAILAARDTFGTETGQLRRTVVQAGRRLTELERGRRIAQAAELVRRLKSGKSTAGLGALAEAEATLRRLRKRQAESVVADMALQMLDADGSPATIADRLAAHGFGSTTHASATDVLNRLRQRAVPALPALAR
jgi:phage shock protein A